MNRIVIAGISILMLSGCAQTGQANFLTVSSNTADVPMVLIHEDAQPQTACAVEATANNQTGEPQRIYLGATLMSCALWEKEHRPQGS